MATIDPEQLKNLGFLGIFKEAYKLTFSRWKPIFCRITLALILPFCLLCFADMHLSNYLSWNIFKHHIDLDDTWSDNPRYDQLKHKLVREWTAFWVLNFVYFVLGLLVFFLFSISAISHTVASIYTAKDTTFKQVMKHVVPKAWKKLVVTFFWNVIIMFVYSIVSLILLVLSIVLARSTNNLVLGITLCVIVVIVYVVGWVYINVIWQMASVVSVLEDKCGLRAIKKSKGLLKGKMMVAIGIFVVFQLVLIGIQGGYYVFVLFAGSAAVVVHVIVGVVCFLGLLKVVLMGLVVQSIVYFVCKSYHHESFDKEHEQLGQLSV